jgi:TRAP transporter 4TM/12TM fusion protein
MEERPMLEKLDSATKLFATCCAVTLSLFSLYTAFFGTIPTMAQRTFHLTTIGIDGLFLFSKAYDKKFKVSNLLINITLAVLLIASNVYLMFNWMDLYINPFLSTIGMIMGVSAVLVILELTRRTVGLALSIIVCIFLLYTYLGSYIPGFLAHRGYSVERILVQVYAGTEGIYGIPVGVCSTLVIVFILFGAFLESTGASDILLKLATSIAGRRRGGPAKVSICASGFMGMLSGSSAANVATTGAITIPMMKKSGFDPYVAGAVEAVSSSGGYKTPPIMGAVAFIMAEMLGASYIDVCIAAAIPSFFHYFGLYIMVDLYAGQKGLKGLPKEKMPSFIESIKEGAWYLLPVLLLIVLMLFRFTAMYACAYSLLALWGISILRKTLSWGAVFQALKSGAERMIVITVPCAAAGIVLGVLTLSGAGMKLSDLISYLAGDSLFLTLSWIMIISIVLGMGLPPVVSYIILAALEVPILVEMGVSPLGAHLFIFYFCALSLITPPICTTSFTAAAIAGSPPMKTGLEAVRFGLVLYTLPYLFVYNPGLLAQGSIVQILYSVVIAGLGVFALAVGAQGYFSRSLGVTTRIAFLTSSVALFCPSKLFTLCGFILLSVLLLILKSSSVSMAFKRKSNLL